MRRIGCVGLLILLFAGYVIYTQWRMQQLRDEVTALTARVHTGTGKNVPGKTGKTDLVTTLAETERHAKRAQELIKGKKLQAAQAELESALKNLKSANKVSSDIVGDAAQYLGTAREKAVNVFQKAWKDISEEAKPAKK